MAADNSFDIVSKVDIQEVRNAIEQAIKEVVAAAIESGELTLSGVSEGSG